MGIGHMTMAENIVTSDMTFARAKGLASSIVLTRRTLRIEYMATYRALSSIADKIAKARFPLGANISTKRPRMPQA